MAKTRLVSAGALLVAALARAAFAQEPKPAPKSPSQTATLPKPSVAWTGDLDGILKRRAIRALVVPTRTQYWIDKGKQTGGSYELLTAFEGALNQKHKTTAKHLKVHVLFIPTSRDQIIPKLLEGKGDIAAAGLTITPERLKQVDFSAPLASGLTEIVVTGPQSPPINSADDLSDQEVFVRKSSSYWTHVEALNDRLKKNGKPPAKLRAAPEDLQDDDLLEMLNAGLIKATVVDRYAAVLWAKVFQKIRPREDAVVNESGEIAWMIRKDSPKLKAEVDAFVATHRLGTAFGNSVVKKYLGTTRFVKPATSDAGMKNYEKTVQFFRKYSSKYEMDYLLMMAQGYQESGLDQHAKSPLGAIGVMQVMPETGKEMKTGNINEMEPNIHAGVKYVRFVQDQFFEKEPMDALNKTLFAFAAYNCGPGRVQQLRREAEAKGLNPNVWFNNVEVIAGQKIGAETVTYVANIYKYYTAYKLVTEDLEAHDKAKAQMKS